MFGILQAVGVVFLVILAGTAAARFRLLSPRTGDALTEFAVTIAVPLLLFRTVLNANFDGTTLLPLWWSYVLAGCCAWVAGCLATRAFGREWQVCVVGGMAACFANLVQLGVPLVQGLYGQPGLDMLTLLVAIQLPLLSGVTILTFEMLGARNAQQTRAGMLPITVGQAIFVNPLMIGILAGFAMRVVDMPLPTLLAQFVDVFAGVAGPVALFAIGFSLYGLGIKGNLRPAVALSAIKLIGMPSIALLMCVLLRLPALTSFVVVAAASLPTGINPYLVASRFGVGQALASNTMTISTALSFLATAFWLTVAKLVIED